MLDLKVGCDPEFFLLDKKTGMMTSAHNLVPGTKAAPYKVKSGAVQADGTAVEFNIEPASSPEEFASNVEAVLKEVRGMVDKRFEFKFEPTVTYAEDYFKLLPDSAKELGCDPDFDAYRGGTENPRPNPSKTPTFRTGSGHIHIGWTSGKNWKEDPSHSLDCVQVVKSLDNHFFEHKHAYDNDTLRETLYGKRGAFRYKPYGVEYRTPSNMWLNNKALWPWIFNSVKFVIEEMEKANDIGPIPTLNFTPKEGGMDETLHWLSKIRALHKPGYPEFPVLKQKPLVKKPTTIASL